MTDNDDREFRENTIRMLTKIDVTVTALDRKLNDHINSDDTKFGTINQQLGTNSDWRNKAVGAVAIIVGIPAFVLFVKTIVDWWSP